MPLDANIKKAVRDEMIAFCNLAEKYESRWSYSQNRPFKGFGAAPQTWHVDDCSAYCSLVFYWAMHHVRAAPMTDPLNYHYSGWGNTGTAYAYLKKHKIPNDNKFYVGDMAIFWNPSENRTVHMMICKKNGVEGTAKWSSFGSQAGPSERTSIYYHPSPLLGVYRHEALL